MKITMYIALSFVLLIVLVLAIGGIIDRGIINSRLAQIDQCRADGIPEHAAKWNQIIRRKQAYNRCSGYVLDWVTCDVWNDISLIKLNN